MLSLLANQGIAFSPFSRASQFSQRSPLLLKLHVSLTPPSLPLGMLEGTSIAALALPNGDWKVFFQATTGQIHHKTYSFQSRTWSSDEDPDSVVVSNARNSTPIAAVPYPTIDENLASTSVSCNLSPLDW